MRLQKLFVLPLLTLSFFNCGGGGGSKSSAKSELGSTLESLAINLVPPALKNSQPLALSAAPLGNHPTSGDPCAGIVDSDPFKVFLSCQPILLRAYIFQARMFLNEAKEIMDGAAAAAEAVASGSGTLTSDEGETINWTKDADNMSIIVSEGNDTLGAATIEGNQIEIWTRGDEIVDLAGGENAAFQGVLNYTDANNWNAEIFFAGIPCDSNDLNAPERLQINVSYINGIWTGKAMTYHPRGSEHTCATTPSNSTAMNVYTDFVGDDTATKASVYMMARNITSEILTNDLADYAIGKFCENYSNICGGNATAYPDITLPFCVTASSDEPSWGNSCASESTTVSEGAYSDASLWIAPYNFYQSATPTPPTQK